MYANTPLHYAQSEEFIEAAIELGANLNLENIDKKKPTEIAAENNDTDIVIALVNRGANPGNAIEHAIKNGNEKMFSAIIDKIPKEKALDLLNLAIKEDFLKGMEPLTLLIGDEVNHTDNNGTILHKIAKSFKSNSKHEDEYVKIVKAMLSVGANPIIEDKFKRIPSDYLSDGTAKSILFEAEKKLEPNELFLENKPNQINKDLHKEISLGNFENAKKLMEQGGELNWAMVVKRQNGARFVVENWQNIQASIDKSKYDHNRIINKE